MMIKLFRSDGVLIKLTSILESLGTINGLADKDKGLSEVITRPFTSGERIGPPADRE